MHPERHEAGAHVNDDEPRHEDREANFLQKTHAVDENLAALVHHSDVVSPSNKRFLRPDIG